MLRLSRVEESCCEPGFHREGYIVFERPQGLPGVWELTFGKRSGCDGFNPSLIRPAAEVIQERVELYQVERNMKAAEVSISSAVSGTTLREASLTGGCGVR